jgi:hypothetical protein
MLNRVEQVVRGAASLPLIFIATAVAALVLAGCNGSPGAELASTAATDQAADAASTSSPVARLRAPTLRAKAPGAPGANGPSAKQSAAMLPNLVGKGLQVAQDRSQAAGFRKLSSHDSLGRARHQILDRDWRVCFQRPAAGRRPSSTTVDFGVVRLDERCPGTDQGAAKVKKATVVMPDLGGKSGAIAIAALGGNASITWRDGTGAGRWVLIPSNWRVCAQAPKPGRRFDGSPVTLVVVKFKEKC